MKTIKLVSLFVFSVLAFQVSAVSASSRQPRSVSGFHGISVSSGIDLYLSQKDVEQVSVEANSDDLDKIVTKVESGILKIYMKPNNAISFSWSKSPRKVYVTFKMLDKLEASSGSDVYSQERLTLNKLNLDASSGADIKLELEVADLSAESSSGSDICLKGKAAVMQCNASSGSDIDAGELEAKKCIASSSSGSDVSVNVTSELDANASSGGDITYSGNPGAKNINESSGGDVHHR